MLSRVEFKEGCQMFLSEWQTEDRTHLSPHQYSAGWKWKPHYSSIVLVNQDLGYLYKDPIDRILFYKNDRDQPSQQELACKEMLGENFVDEHKDEATISELLQPNQFNHHHKPIKFKSSIVYSDTYKVPQLIFQAYNLDGTSLGLDELLNTDIFYPVPGLEGGEEEYPMNLIKTNNKLPQKEKAGSSESGGQKEEEKEEPEVRLPILTRIVHPIDNELYWALHSCNTQKALEDVLSTGTDNYGSEKQPSPQLIIECFFALISSLIRI
ncbi:hypothetical protein PCASD_11222 [Puccinia coronata f. sp. avenae]|uniref:Ubiquitin-like-conjugating enzyme ATG10 n=1 Tax=Puccinia coronata f. sp. avenae TaxID=200324 RepID=A0A2N5UBS5_9BASI|nr:hypothetical protein PCASD_23916 [Puccinia coronata f. sp. avenae]PLW35168.1 hypothetical protein PCASD_11222 [Puccinia coronata f. sp. avenae]